MCTDLGVKLTEYSEPWLLVSMYRITLAEILLSSVCAVIMRTMAMKTRATL